MPSLEWRRLAKDMEMRLRPLICPHKLPSADSIGKSPVYSHCPYRVRAGLSLLLLQSTVRHGPLPRHTARGLSVAPNSFCFKKEGRLMSMRALFI